ncbi:MAG: glucose-1-phosphate adenylyltransferase [Chloroflexi bacterium]|nr:glucose-1-phosphate adenylyltransferase [Chloroflexota bacterium]
MPTLSNTLAVIMGGGVGKRLYPLTKQRSKPAVPIAGKYRLIDVPLSNCLNSGINQIAVLTQFNSVSLHRHITQTYTFDDFHSGWVQILAAEQTPRSTDWYQGTADAVRKQLFEIKSTGADTVLILAGDHLYRMDYSEMAEFHWANGADITVAVQPAALNEATRMGILKRNPDQRISAFVEKPRDPEVLAQFVSRDDPNRPYLGSMGIYIFNADVLVDVLENSSHDDFGGQIIPNAIHTHNVFGFDFDGYWEDIGTIRSFYETNLKLAEPDSPFNFYDPVRPIYTRQRHLPSTLIHGARLHNVLITEGCQINEAEVADAVIGLRSYIADGVKMSRTILMGSDYYDALGKPLPGGLPLGVGPNCQIEGAIIDKNVRMGEGVVIRPFPRGVEKDEGAWVVQDGIVVIPKSTVLYPGTYIGPEE